MENSKREVWEAAKQCGVDGFISAVGKAFPDAIDGVAVSARGVGVLATDDRMLINRDRVIPGTRVSAAERKALIDNYRAGKKGKVGKYG